jgi:aryl-alcohol dehydrogenase-like predicted oxidoreductase
MVDAPGPLERRRLGADGPEITTVGFGAWAAGGGGWAFGWGPQDDDHSIAAIRHAVEQGVSWIDTAAVYGLGHSEEVVRRALEPFAGADRPSVFTKCGLVWDDADPMAPSRRVASPEHVRQGCEDSLRRLGVEAIDLFQIHWPDESGVPVEESWGAMHELVAEGKVRWAGVSNFDVGLLERCQAVGPVTSLQPPFSLLRRDAAEDLLPWCERHGVGVIVYSPMQAGLLTGAFTAERAATLPEDDWRRDDWNFTEGLERNLDLVERLRPLAELRGVSVGALAVAWTLAWPSVTGAIVGARSAAQVDGWVPASSLDLTPDELDQIEGHLDATGVGDGPCRPPGPRPTPTTGQTPGARDGGWWRRLVGRRTSP